MIGVNFAVFTENQASNFAVPIRFGIPLLERTGWEAPAKETKEGETSRPNAQPDKSGSTVGRSTLLELTSYTVNTSQRQIVLHIRLNPAVKYSGLLQCTTCHINDTKWVHADLE